MILILLLIAVFLIGYYAIKAIALALFGIEDDQKYVDKSTTINHYHYTTTNNHLHIDKEDAQKSKK